MAKRIGVLLAGCGYLDGAEVHEATLTLYFLDKAGAEIIPMAPDKPQADVVNHQKGEPSGETRNVLAEAARISRGNMKDVAAVSADDLDALIIPGGFGAAKNLCTFAKDGPDCTVDPGVEKLVRAMRSANKPIGALCIAPALLAKVLGPDHHVEVTIGNDEGTAKAIESLGAKHVNKPVEDIVVDDANKVVTTPCYMLGPGPAAVGAGIEKLVDQVLSWL
ncbi:MAG: isoprenoid biosynthesis glyoxalase ElbB [Deltaproteobacteria bacterium]|jgi:enhancing lycopene biosynthesis protein 2|nr:isoprenoid biosynthesis glyoxalase ElbB [Deltaproteobacteria bacterium]MBW2531305.1 isoprenoid biosynthesis glyoxalase ElbB [Deltaproteobacteria bacterium]